MTREEKLKILIDSGEYDFLKNIPENELWKVFFMATFVGTDTYAVPVVHAHWKDNKNGTVSCSRCSTWFQKERVPYLRFCGYCGARMDGKGEE